MRSLGIGLMLMAVAACGGGNRVAGDGDDGDDDGPEDAAVAPDAGPTPVRFVVLGDTGEGNQAQRDVATAMKTVCDAAGGCDFALLLGDNIYDDGVTGTDDMQWQTKFEQPYAALNIPFYAVLGNHDYGGQIIIPVPGVGNEWDKGPIEVMYTEVSDKWEMPATHYTFTVGNVGIIALDTNSIVWGNLEHGDQRAWYPSALAEVADADWKIVAGHHPYRSNGTHGNAGDYDAPEIAGIPIPNPLPIVGGGEIKTFFDEVVCGTVDLAFAGHDHNRQWLDESERCGGTELIVSGAGAKLTEYRDRGNRTHFMNHDEEGFLFVEVVGKRLTGRFYGKDGGMDFERTLTKP
ncbi:MAG TPA: metallophosphoesterase [Kofleriaceae bacterium]|nr:metallophosphoesterase [Kofleriaceae bacterium]